MSSFAYGYSDIPKYHGQKRKDILYYTYQEN